MTAHPHVEDALRRLRGLLRFAPCYVADVRDLLEDLATREIADALGNDSYARTIHGEPNLVKRIEWLEGQLETARIELAAQRGTPRVGTSLEPTPRAPRPARAPRLVCTNGHSLTGDNVATTKKGQRICKTCRRDYMRDWQRRRVAQRQAPL